MHRVINRRALACVATNEARAVPYNWTSAKIAPPSHIRTPGNDSLLSFTWNVDGSVVEVQVDTVGNYCSRNGIESVSLLKIDAQ